MVKSDRILVFGIVAPILVGLVVVYILVAKLMMEGL